MNAENTLTVKEAYQEVIIALEEFERIDLPGITMMQRTITNVRFSDLIILYHLFGPTKAQIYLPGEFHPLLMAVVYTPWPGWIINLYSDHAYLFKAKQIQQFNLN